MRDSPEGGAPLPMVEVGATSVWLVVVDCLRLAPSWLVRLSVWVVLLPSSPAFPAAGAVCVVVFSVDDDTCAMAGRTVPPINAAAMNKRNIVDIERILL